MADSEERIKISFDTNADDTKKSVDGLNASIDVSVTENQNLSNAQGKVSKSSKEQKAGFDSLGSGIGGAIQQVKGLGKQFLALLANPVILFLAAIVGALALLFKAFTSTNAGADKMEQIMAAVSAVVDVLRDRFLQLFNALTSFDFDGIIASFSGVGEEIEKEAKKAMELAQALQEVGDATRDLGVSRAKLNRDLAESKAIIDSENASYEEKKIAIEAVKKAEAEQTEQELANAKKKLAAITEQNELSDSSDEALQKQADAQSAVFALEQKSAEDRRQIRRTEERADNEEKTRIKGLQDERNRISKEREKVEQEALKKREDDRAKELENIKKFNNDKLNAEKEFFEQLMNAQKERDDISAEEKERGLKLITDLEKQYSDRQIEIDRNAVEQKKLNQDLLVSQGETLIANVARLAGKNRSIQKAAIIAEGGVSIGKAVANTSEAVTKDLAKGFPASVPLVALDLAVGATSVASIIKGTSQALKAVGGGSAPTAKALPSVRGAAATPQTGFQASVENQIATSISARQTEAPIVKAYVVSQDMTDQQKKDSNLISQNSFGG